VACYDGIMSLTLGSIAPFGRPTGGRLNIELPDTPAHLLYIHALPARIRGVVDGVTVVDTTAATMLHETRLLPRWYLPRADVRTELLEPSETSTHCPFKGDARYWHLRVGDRVIEDAFWEYPEPLPTAPDLSGLLSPYLEHWGTWLEEDEEVVGHPRDPFHRVDVLRSSRPVQVRVGEHVVARSARAMAVNETGFPTRWYLPVDDVEAGALTRTETSTICPYKGSASYWDLDAAGRHFADAVWCYEDPRPEAAPLAGLVSFLADGIEVDVD
jgi:uncharacterized protein (DUF427 family)